MIGSESEAKAFCRTLVDETVLARIDHYIGKLTSENEAQNLVSAASLASVWQRHIADSLQLLRFVPDDAEPWLDLGSGAGPPGLLIAIARPERRIVLVESRRRRARWLESLANDLALVNCRIVAGQVETYATTPFNAISARAFAPLGRLFRLSARFSTPNTYWVLPKGRSAANELAEQPALVRSMFHVEQSLTDPQAGILVGRGRPVIE